MMIKRRSQFQVLSMAGVSALGLLCPNANAAILHSEPAGYTVTVVPTGTNISDVVISGSSGSNGIVQIWSDDGSDSIRKLTVQDTNTNGSRLNILIQNPNQSTTRIVNITGWLGDAIVFTGQPFDLKIVEISGNLNGKVDANTIGTIDVGGSIDADIQSMGDIDLVQAVGDIKGSISTIDISGLDKYGRIRQIIADSDKNGAGNLGAAGAGNELVINYGSPITNVFGNGDDGMELLSGANAYVNLDGTFGNPNNPGGNGGGWFARFETTDVNNGILSGSFKVNRLVDLGGGLSDIDIKGNIDAAITVDWIDRTLLQSGGDFNGSFQSTSDFWFDPGSTNSHPGITVNGNLNGTISFLPFTNIGGCTNCPDAIGGKIWIKGDLAPNASIFIDRDDVMFQGDPTDAIVYSPAANQFGQIVIDGNMLGTIQTIGGISGVSQNDGMDEIDITGMMDGFIDITGDIDLGTKLSMNTIEPAGEMWISNNFNGKIAVSPLGLAGQIIINAADGGGTWNTDSTFGVVEAGNVVLTTPKYAQTPDTLGGGAVGEVKFMLHDEASEPVNYGSGSNLSVIKLRFYGPVLERIAPVEAFPPVKVERQVGPGWDDVTSFMAYDFSPYDLVNGVFNTTLNIRKSGGGIIDPGTYRISRTANLVSDFGTMPDTRAFGTDGHYYVTVN